MFKEERGQPIFDWSMIGDVDVGRPNLGHTTEVAVYRLLQFSLRDVLISRHGVREADRVFYEAGYLAGKEYYKNVITRKDDFNSFIEDLQKTLKDIKIGILKVEESNFDNLSFTITIAEDLDCSGLPVCDENICTYDEGFIAGVLSEHTGKRFRAKEVDCWCSGDRVCRFEVDLM